MPVLTLISEEISVLHVVCSDFNARWNAGKLDGSNRQPDRSDEKPDGSDRQSDGSDEKPVGSIGKPVGRGRQPVGEVNE